MLLTKLEKVFEVFADEQDAINSFFPGRFIIAIRSSLQSS